MTETFDLGPLVGIDYVTRQRVTAAVKEGASRARAATERACERRDERPVEGSKIFTGRAAYAAAWKKAQVPRFLAIGGLCLSALLLAGGYCTVYYHLDGQLGWANPDMSTLTHDQMRDRDLSALGFLDILLASAALACMSFPVRRGYRPAKVARRMADIASKTWVVGEKCILVSAPRGGEHQKADVQTVYYDAIGAVDIDVNVDGLDVVTIRSRDGTVISDMEAPSTCETDNARVIADIIADRAATARQGIGKAA